jgi:PPM family protein phosphatase
MYRISHCTEIGCGRENEDAFAVQAHPADPNCLLCVVADGQGGQAGGGPAARLACRTCIELAAAVPVHRLWTADTWTKILTDVDRAVCADPAAGFTTLIGLSVVGGRVRGASVGDSAAMLACAGQPVRVLTERQIKDPAVGWGTAAAVGFGADLVAPWTLLVMTDGVWKYAGWEKLRISAASEQRSEIFDTLKAAVRLRSGAYPDDFTLVAVQSEP